MREEGIHHLPTGSIDPGLNDRTVFDPAALRDLAESIRQHGLLEPIIVVPNGDRFRIVAGERRWRAHLLAGLPTVKAIVRYDMTREAESIAMLVENVNRVDLNPMDEAVAYKTRMDEFGWTYTDLAERAGLRPEVVKWRAELLNLIPEAQQWVRSGAMTVGVAWEAARLDHNRQVAAFRALADEGLSYLAWRQLCLDLYAAQQQDAFFDPDDFLVLEEFVTAAKAKKATKGEVVALLAKMAEKVRGLDVHGLSDLIAQADIITGKAAA